MSDIVNRKEDHIRLTLTNESQYESGNGLAKYKFLHNALPELDFDEVSTEATLLGRTFSAPMFISSMTGGYQGGTSINEMLAIVCENENLPMGVGSQRAMLEDNSLTKTFSSARKSAPTAWIASNIGGCQIRTKEDQTLVKKAIDAVRADAIIVHLNPLQELMQPEGDRAFTGILKGIEDIKRSYTLPLIVKETGAGLSSEVISRLISVGVDVIDIAASGGTSWAKVENLRSTQPMDIFNNWGIPLDKLLLEQYDRDKSKYELIASGGIRTSFDILKSLCLGADFTASAQPFIKAIKEGGVTGLEELLRNWKTEIKTGMCLLGCRSIKQLHKELLFL